MNGMRIVCERHDSCQCAFCDHVVEWPEMPSLNPVVGKKDIWKMDCHWHGPVFDGCGVEIRRGFETDGASIPRFAWTIIGHPFRTDLLPFALGHDALYAGELLTRDESDDWLLETCEAGGVNIAKRNAVWAAVRSGGWYVWNRHTKDSVERARRLCGLYFTKPATV